MSGFVEPWYDLWITEGVTPDLPGIYEWRIEGVGSYIGKYTHSRRPLKEYARHVRSQFEGGHYRPGNKDGWRRIHVELYRACKAHTKITLIFVENCTLADLNERERYHIRSRGNLNGARIATRTSADERTDPPMSSSIATPNPIEELAARLALYQRLVSQFETSSSLLPGCDAAAGLSRSFISDLNYLLDVSDVDHKIDVLDAFNDELERHAIQFETMAAELEEDR